MQFSAVLFALAASVVSASQVFNSSCISYSTLPSTITVTNLITSTYCPVCDIAKSTNGVYVTTYETIYASVCPTGITSAKYTITQTCTGTTPINPSTCPPGYTTVATVCTACPGAPTLTITQPCDDCTPTPVPVIPAVTPGKTVPVIPAVTPGKTIPGTPIITKPAEYTGAASMLSFSGIVVVAGVGSTFLGLLL